MTDDPAWGAGSARHETTSERWHRYAAHACEQAETARRAGDRATALRWLERAGRIAPADLTVRSALATALLGIDDARAAALFAALAEPRGRPAAWFGLAVARRNRDDAAGAADALGRGLARHVVSPDLGPTADVIAGAAGAPGWCGITPEHGLCIAVARPGQSLRISVDGQAVALLPATPKVVLDLPADWRLASRLEVHAGADALLGSPLDLAAIAASGATSGDPSSGVPSTTLPSVEPPPRRRPRVEPAQGSIILVSHDQEGGVGRHLAARCREAKAEGLRPIVLRPPPSPPAGRDPMETGTVLLDGSLGDVDSRRFTLPRECVELVGRLRAERPLHVEFHHMLGHDPGLLRLPALLGVPHVVRIHDYAWLCPRVVLLGSDERYCGEPPVASCEACVATHGHFLGEEIGVAALRARSAALLRTARRIEAPSRDTAMRLRRHFPGLAVDVRPHAPEPPMPALPCIPAHGRVRVCVVGAIGAAKGYNVLLDLARDAARRDLALEFVVVGHTIDDLALLETGRAFVTGPYRPEEVVGLIGEQQAHLGLLPSTVPETWCYALTEAWQAGLRVVAFDLGAQAERIRRGGGGWLLPRGLTGALLNDAVLAIAQQNRHEWAQPIAAGACAFVSS